MTPGPATLLRRLAELSQVGGQPHRFVVAFSGGLDSTVLAHLLVETRQQHRASIALAHVDHGLQAESAGWSDHCRSFADTHGLEFIGCRVTVDSQSGLGPEAAAREARYAALRDLLDPGDWLLSAHHEDDQAETVLLNLMRGSGPAGLAGIGAVRPFAAGWLVRPLLDVPRSALLDYANAHSLAWIEDPSNQDAQFDRNYLRHEVLPRLDARWPKSAQRIRRSAGLAGEAAALLADLAAEDAARMGGRKDRLSVAGLCDLAPARQRNLLRHVLLQLGLPMPGAAQLEKIVTDLVNARDDAQPLVTWPGAMARRYRGQLYLLSATDAADAAEMTQGVGAERIVLRRGLGMLVFQQGAPHGLSDAVFEHRLELRYRIGGEEIKPINHRHTKKLKKLLQEEGVVPWMRDQIPLLYADGELVAVADLWIAAGAASEPGTAIAWHNRPAIH